MKKILVMAGAAMAMLTMASCSGSGSCNGHDHCDNKADQLYTGVLPAADCDGIRYALTLDYDDDHGCKNGDYDLMETYLTGDSTAVGGVADGQTFKSEGDFTVIEKNGKKYLKLVKDVKDSHANAAETLYFEIDNDSTITLVNSDLERATSELNYTLKLAR